MFLSLSLFFQCKVLIYLLQKVFLVILRLLQYWKWYLKSRISNYLLPVYRNVFFWLVPSLVLHLSVVNESLARQFSLSLFFLFSSITRALLIYLLLTPPSSDPLPGKSLECQYLDPFLQSENAPTEKGAMKCELIMVLALSNLGPLVWISISIKIKTHIELIIYM